MWTIVFFDDYWTWIRILAELPVYLIFAWVIIVLQFYDEFFIYLWTINNLPCFHINLFFKLVVNFWISCCFYLIQWLFTLIVYNIWRYNLQYYIHIWKCNLYMCVFGYNFSLAVVTVMKVCLQVLFFNQFGLILFSAKKLISFVFLCSSKNFFYTKDFPRISYKSLQTPRISIYFLEWANKVKNYTLIICVVVISKTQVPFFFM